MQSQHLTAVPTRLLATLDPTRAPPCHAHTHEQTDGSVVLDSLLPGHLLRPQPSPAKLKKAAPFAIPPIPTSPLRKPHFEDSPCNSASHGACVHAVTSEGLLDELRQELQMTEAKHAGVFDRQQQQQHGNPPPSSSAFQTQITSTPSANPTIVTNKETATALATARAAAPPEELPRTLPAPATAVPPPTTTTTAKHTAHSISQMPPPTAAHAKDLEASLAALPLPPCMERLHAACGILAAVHKFVLSKHVQPTWLMVQAAMPPSQQQQGTRAALQVGVPV